MAIDLNVVAEEMYQMVEKDTGVKKYKPADLFKAMMKKHESEGLSKKDCKAAVRILIDSEKLIYTYYNGSFVELPHADGAAVSH